MTRHGLKFCMLCSPTGNGIEGTTPAIGKYFLQEAKNNPIWGWIPVCVSHAIECQRLGFNVIPLAGHEYHPFFQDQGNGNIPMTYGIERCAIRSCRRLIISDHGHLLYPWVLRELKFKGGIRSMKICIDCDRKMSDTPI